MFEKKLQYFTDAINREIQTKRKHARHQVANDLSNQTASALEAAENRAEFQREATRRKLWRESNKKIASATAEARANLAAKRESLKNQLLNEAAKDLRAFAENSPEYETYLIERITQAQEWRSFSSVKLRPQDMHYAEAIRQATGFSPEEGEADYIGGFVLQSATSRADYTFKARLQIFS